MGKRTVGNPCRAFDIGLYKRKKYGGFDCVGICFLSWLSMKRHSVCRILCFTFSIQAQIEMILVLMLYMYYSVLTWIISIYAFFGCDLDNNDKKVIK